MLKSQKSHLAERETSSSRVFTRNRVELSFTGVSDEPVSDWLI